MLLYLTLAVVTDQQSADVDLVCVFSFKCQTLAYI